MKPAPAVTFGSRAVPSFWPVLWPEVMEPVEEKPVPKENEGQDAEIASPSHSRSPPVPPEPFRAEADGISEREELAAPRSAPPPRNSPPPRRPGRPAAEPGQRPRYLLVALIVAFVFGVGCWMEGCARLGFYRGEREQYVAQTEAVPDDADRGRSEQLYQRFIEASDVTRGRGVPLAAATFVLGAALLALAARGLAGKANTRAALMQVIAAQAIVVAATFFATRDMRRAEDDWQYQTALFQRRDKIPQDQYVDVTTTLNILKRWAPPGWLALRSLASVLIILALSRPRSREFFDAARPVSER